MVAANAGAVLAGTRETGFWAVWQEQADNTRTASAAIRSWSFATRIFLYEIRSALRDLDLVHSIKIVPRGLVRVNAQKERQPLRSAPGQTVTGGSPYSDDGSRIKV